jgi:hypothetical protein
VGDIVRNIADYRRRGYPAPGLLGVCRQMEAEAGSIICYELNVHVHSNKALLPLSRSPKPLVSIAFEHCQLLVVTLELHDHIDNCKEGLHAPCRDVALMQHLEKALDQRSQKGSALQCLRLRFVGRRWAGLGALTRYPISQLTAFMDACLAPLAHLNNIAEKVDIGEDRTRRFQFLHNHCDTGRYSSCFDDDRFHIGHAAKSRTSIHVAMLQKGVADFCARLEGRDSEDKSVTWPKIKKRKAVTVAKDDSRSSGVAQQNTQDTEMLDTTDELNTDELILFDIINNNPGLFETQGSRSNGIAQLGPQGEVTVKVEGEDDDVQQQNTEMLDVEVDPEAPVPDPAYSPQAYEVENRVMQQDTEMTEAEAAIAETIAEAFLSWAPTGEYDHEHLGADMTNEKDDELDSLLGSVLP